jgi:virulence-associated protein VagC
MNIPEKFGFNCPSGFSKEVMVATAGLSLTLEPMGKMFQNANLIEA